MDLIKLFNKEWRLKQFIDNFFEKKYSIYRKRENLLTIILEKKYDTFIFIINYCFEKNYIINNNKFQNNLLYLIKKEWDNGLINIDIRKKYEWILYNILTPDKLNNSKVCYVHLIFEKNTIIGKKFINKIFRYLDNIKYIFNNPNKKCLLTCAILSDNLYGIEELLLRGFNANSKDIHNIIEFEIIKNLCLLKYEDNTNDLNSTNDLNTYLSNNTNDLSNNTNDLSNNTNDLNNNSSIKETESIHSSLINYNGSENNYNSEIESNYSVDYNGSETSTETGSYTLYNLSYDDLNIIKYHFNKIIYDYLINIIFIQNKNNINTCIIQAFSIMLSTNYSNYIYDIDDLKYLLLDYEMTYLKSNEFYEKKYEILLILKKYGFVSTNKIFQKYKNGSKLIEMCYPNMHQLFFKIFKS